MALPSRSKEINPQLQTGKGAHLLLPPSHPSWVLCLQSCAFFGVMPLILRIIALYKVFLEILLQLLSETGEHL